MKQLGIRAIGVCKNEECIDAFKGVFLLRRGIQVSGAYFCSNCRNEGTVAQEQGEKIGSHEFYREVRVEFDYDCCTGEYRSVAVVQDSLLPEGSTYVFYSPLIRTEKRALTVAEAMFSSLNIYREPNIEGIPRITEKTISMDSEPEIFEKELRKVFGTIR